MSRAEFYRLVSAAVKRTLEGLPEPAARFGAARLAVELERAFAAHNEKFDAVRFRRDCGLE